MVRYAIEVPKKNKMSEEWLEKLLRSKFFGSCFDHQELRKNEMNVFCIDCNKCICQHCLYSHFLHKMLQIRRYVYQDVVRLQDMQKHINCSGIQTYITNNAKVVFLNTRPQSKPSKSNSGSSCEICERSLMEPNRYCSVACKVSIIADESINQSSAPHTSFQIPISSAISEKENRNPKLNMKEDKSSNSIEAEAESKWVSTEAESNPENNHNHIGWLNSSCFLKPKKQLHKRKGTPHRAPLC